jgi:peptide chain release factor subunit 1
MQTNDLDETRLRELASLRPDGARVLSVFLNLDPQEFSQAPARTTEIQSVLDDAERRVRDANDSVSPDEKKALREDVERTREFLKGADFKGAHGFVVYASGAAGLFEALRLPRPVSTRAVIDDSPFIEPLVEICQKGSWAVILVNRKVGRMFRGSPERLDELPRVEDDVHGRHQQGGLSQARYQRSVDEGARDHYKNVAEAAFRRFQTSPFDQLLIGGPGEDVAEFETRLHSYLKQRVAGRVEVDVENTSADQVLKAARADMEALERKREEELLDRLRQGLATGGRGAAGLDDTLAALNERRVEVLMLADGFDAAGTSCPQCGWVGAPELTVCPADGSKLEPRESVAESALELAIEQSAEVLRVRGAAGEIESHGGIAAVLRF